MAMRKVKVIKVTPGNREKLMARTGKKISAVYAALRYASFGEGPDEIRRLALNEYGGVECVETRL